MSGESKQTMGALALGAIGVVFGDIGTSPLYTLGECIRVSGEHLGHDATRAEVLGILSLIFWALTLVVTLKYLVFIMRADNHGEGGILALLAIVPQQYRTRSSGTAIVAILVIIGAALLYGDGAITPAISVLSAMEGVGVARPELSHWIVPATCVILVGLFSIQRHGTQTIGKLFGPVMVLWFVTIGALGAWHIAKDPAVLAAVLPTHAAWYLGAHGWKGTLILGSVVLAVTGGEALYADMGHFGRKPIRLSWIALVKPALLLCYFGQGALVLTNAKAAENPFFSMVSGDGPTFALVILSSAATVIASQALISGAFSLTRQAMQLGFMPRLTIKHTAAEAEGQIYVPQVNWMLMIACLILVLAFQKSSNLAAAYGIAVTGTMGITSLVYYVVTRRTWGWSIVLALPVLLLFLAFDVPFFATNLFKIFEGGYVPIAIAAALATLMLIWARGRRLLHLALAEKLPSLEVGLYDAKPIARIPGCAIFMTSNLAHVPPTFLRHVQRNRVLHEHMLFIGVTFETVPYVSAKDRYEVAKIRDDAHTIKIHFGYMEEPRVVPVLERATDGLDCDLRQATYYVGRETILAGPGGKMGVLTESIFAFLQRNAVAADRSFGIPPGQVVELGSQVDL